MKYADFIERKRHGSPGFPIQYYYVDKKHPQYVMPPHWHKEFEIVRVVKGKFKAFLNNEEYSLSGGDILLVESGTLHRGEPDGSIYECIVFDLNMLMRQQNDAACRFILPFADSTVKINRVRLSAESNTGKVIDSLFCMMSEENSYRELGVYSLLFDLFFKLYTSGAVKKSESMPHNHKTETVTRLLDWLDNNFSEPVTLEKMSQISGFSPKYLCRIFKEYTSKTLISYINELRIENACYEMSAKGKSVTHAAFDSGFNDLSYFCKTFKKYKNITPNEFKKTLKREL